jgi:hypothetical protein
MRAPENYHYTQAAAGNGTAFAIQFGGLFSVDVVATGISGTNTVELQVLGPDASTWLSIYDTFNNAGAEADLIVGKFGANGSKHLYLSPGQYRFVVTTATLLSANISRIPND